MNSDEEWDFRQYKEDHHLTHVCKAGQNSPSELEWADLEDRDTDSEVGRHLTNRDVGNEYLDATRREKCDVFVTYQKNECFETLQHQGMPGYRGIRIGLKGEYR